MGIPHSSKDCWGIHYKSFYNGNEYSKLASFSLPVFSTFVQYIVRLHPATEMSG